MYVTMPAVVNLNSTLYTVHAVQKAIIDIK